jgi:hypothetical protein
MAKKVIKINTNPVPKVTIKTLYSTKLVRTRLELT